jgi:glucosyl-3-phosphoglycerate synthase
MASNCRAKFTSKNITEEINRWLTTNMYHNSEFSDINALVELKEKSSTTISLCFPTLNEETTIGPIIRTMRSGLMEKYPLIDEIIVVDSGSTDGTREAATDAGADFYYASDYLKDEGVYNGKGENLWKSLYLTRGDIILWIDSDIKNIHPKFAYGIIGTLLKRPDVVFCKGFYERPLNVDGTLRHSEGGRVTEILMRPLINHFFPNLSGFIQPLSGEYGGRRELFEQIPFFTGYGIEIGMLIDIVNHFGLDAVAQVDLDVRVHRNQRLENLGKMAFGILQSFFKRCHELDIIDLTNAMKETFLHVTADAVGYDIIEKNIVEFERPPMAGIEDYILKHEKYSQSLCPN